MITLCSTKSSKCDEEDYFLGSLSPSPKSPKSPEYFRSPQQKPGTTPTFYQSPLGSPTKSSSLHHLKNASFDLNEEEFVFLQSPKHGSSVDEKHSSVDDDATPSTIPRSNSSGLILVSLLSPTNKGMVSKKSFIFEIQSPRKNSADVFDETSTHLNLKHIATIDQFTTVNKKILAKQKVLKQKQDNNIYGVRFKVHTKFYVAEDSDQISLGHYVIVEGDRGSDLGVVVSMHTRTGLKRMKVKQTKFEKILRLAYYPEYQALMQKYYDEQSALDYIKELAAGLPLNILNCEFQFDREKIVIYYESDKYVDFRKFLTAVYATFRTRVWMERITPDDDDDNVLSILESAAIPRSSRALCL